MSTAIYTAPNGTKAKITFNDQKQLDSAITELDQKYGQANKPLIRPGGLLADAALPTITGGLAAIPAGLAGLGALPFGLNKSAEVIGKVQNALTYEPRTQVGELGSKIIGYPSQLLGKGADVAGSYALEKTGSPLAATAVNTAIQSAPMWLSAALSRRSRATAPEAAPTSEQLLEKGTEAYKAADEAGVTIKPGVLDKPIQELTTKLTKEGLDNTLHPKATRALERLSELQGQPATLSDLEVRRRIANDVVQGLDRPERRIGREIINKIDDTMENLKPEDISSGDAKAGVASLTEARDLWRRARKGEVLDDLVSRAGTRAGQFSGSGFENAIRTEFRQLALNKKRLAGFTAAEQEAIQAVARGGPISNAIRFLGKFSIRGPVSAGVNMGAGAIGGPMASVAMAGAGEIGRLASSLGTQRRAAYAGDLVRRGGELPPQSLPPYGAIDAPAGLLAGGMQASQDDELRKLLESSGIFD